MDALRFLTMLAAAVAAWMVLMWFALAAVSAAPDAHGDPAHPSPPAAATAVDDAARPSAGGGT